MRHKGGLEGESPVNSRIRAVVSRRYPELISDPELGCSGRGLPSPSSSVGFSTLRPHGASSFELHASRDGIDAICPKYYCVKIVLEFNCMLFVNVSIV